MGQSFPKEVESRSKRIALIPLISGLIMGFCLARALILLKSNRLKFKTSFEQFDDYDTKLQHPPIAYNGNSSLAAKLYNETRVLCWIMTQPKNHVKKARHVLRTWGKRCNKLLFMSTDHSNELSTIVLNVKEGHNYLWTKTRAAFKYIYEHHLEDADWFFKAEDDTYAVVENLRVMLYPHSPQTPIYFGCKFKTFIKQGYMSSTAGYVLSKEALRRFVLKALPDSDICKSNSSNSEAIEMGRCLENVNVTAGDSRDKYGRGRFFPFEPVNHLRPTRTSKDLWFWRHSYYKLNKGLNCCSDHAITFHHVSPNQMYVLDYLIYYLRPYGIVNRPEKLPKRHDLNVASVKPSAGRKFF